MPTFLRRPLVLALLALAPGVATIAADADPAALLPADARQAAAAIDDASLRGSVRFLGHDLLEGRGPGTRGDELARLYLATELEKLGYEPGGPGGSWEQPMDIVGVDSAMPETWTFRSGDRELALARSTEYIATSGVQAEQASLRDADLVFVGYGIEAPEFDWNDFKGADLAGKVLVMLNNDPDWDPELFEGERRLYYGRWTYKYESAARQGAAGAIIIHTRPSAGYGWNVVQSSWTGPQFELPAADEPRIQVAGWATEDAARRLVALGGHDLEKLVAAAKRRDFAPVPLGIRTSLALRNTIERTRTANVLGLLHGSDPQLRDEVVVYTAHHDHIGIGAPDAEGDRIYNGARDNAGGVAQILGVARAYTELAAPPRRSVLILFVAAEEQGLIGSEYYARHPTFPAGRIAGGVNMDGPGIWGPTRDVTYVGMGKSGDLDAVARSAAALQGREVKGDQEPDKGSFYRSDQFSLARVGVPFIYLGGGSELRDQPANRKRELSDAWTAAHYHQPSDELADDWNFAGMVEDAQLGFLAGLMIAQRDAMPAWNPGDEFEAARKEALAAVEADAAGR